MQDTRSSDGLTAPLRGDGGKQILVWVLRSCEACLHHFGMRANGQSHIFGNRNAMAKDSRLLNVADKPPLVVLMLHASVVTQRHHIGYPPARCSEDRHDRHVHGVQVPDLGVELAE